MRYARLVLANMGRNKSRTILTVLSVAVAFFLFASLRSVLTALEAASEVGSESRLVTSSASGITFPLPQAHTQRIRAVEGVGSVSWANWFGGVYIDARNFFAQFAIDAETYLPMYPEIDLPEDQHRPQMASGRTWPQNTSSTLQSFVLTTQYSPPQHVITLRRTHPPEHHSDQPVPRHLPAARPVLVQRGYAVLLPNVRGSSGYGKAFEDGNNGCWGHCDLEDVVGKLAELHGAPDTDLERRVLPLQK